MIERRRLVVSDGLELDAGMIGAEAPVGVAVLLHGIPSAAPPDPSDAGYAGFARRFAEHGWTAVWADLRAARGAPGTFSIEGWVRDALAVIDSVTSDSDVKGLPLVLIGSSTGGAVASEAIVRGASVDYLVLLGVPATWDGFAPDAAEGLRRITQEAGMSVAPEVQADPTEWAAEFDRVTAEVSIESVKVPVLILHGDLDDVVPVDHARRIATRAQAATVQIIEGAGHQLRRDERALALIFDWLGRTPS